MIRECNSCKKEYEANEIRVKHNRNLFCSYDCGKKKLKKPNFIKCLVCNKDFHRCESLIKSDNIFCSIKCKSQGMVEHLTKSMRKGTGVYDLITSKIRRKYYKYNSFDFKKLGNKVDYTVNEFIERIKGNECSYCGENTDELGLDRIDNTKGHTLNNTVVCCSVCNMTRGDRFTYEEMKLIGDTIKKIKLNRNEKI